MSVDLAVTRSRGVVRLHRITCKRLRPGQAAPLALVAPALVGDAVTATCCKPRAAAAEARNAAWWHTLMAGPLSCQDDT